MGSVIIVILYNILCQALLIPIITIAYTTSTRFGEKHKTTKAFHENSKHKKNQIYFKKNNRLFFLNKSMIQRNLFANQPPNKPFTAIISTAAN
ncbi:uncharacterized protein TOL2_C09000 [Desulfobacula toluolica Tol2]|uniref:Uncharacterized protein n=1 Tax=Desulfobacula toluolica (strain DSM 7467 / Tol2) TaxID=651182 RepID=K0NGV6_DESTT|nr:uncharacterized protein TOL2_C09000 [Desulfobacula toluolica Tol2]